MIVADQPVWRADLFDRVDGVRGGFEAAHFHPHFLGVEPSERHWEDAVKTAPWDWLHACLTDVADIAAVAGVRLRNPGTDSEQIRADAQEIVAAAQRRDATQCASKQQCHAWTQDVTHAVDLMIGSLARPDLLDQDRVSPWLAKGPRSLVQDT
jgi:hypothetical protein